MKYDNPEEGEWINPVMGGYKMACCDCGLVHKMNFSTYEDEDGNQRVEFQAFRDNRATGQFRRHMKVSSQAELPISQVERSETVPTCGDFIKCSDELPDNETKKYLVLRDGNIEIETWIYKNSEGYWYDYFGITHWTHLPKLPSE